MSGNIFINYRRDDASYPAGRLYDRLSAHFPKNQVFIDVDNLDPGVDFVETIEQSVGSCDALIAVIGKRWLISSDEEGSRRLDNPDDFVRLEIATALKRNIRVIPVLVDGASMPPTRDLPDDLKSLVRRNAVEVSHSRFSADSERLIAALERIFEKTAAEQREREEKERLEAERRQKEEQERLETERRDTQAKEHLEAERRQKEEQERLEAERLERPEKERLEAERQERERLDREDKRRMEAERRERAEARARLVAKFSFVPFILVLLSYFLPLVDLTNYGSPIIQGYNYGFWECSGFRGVMTAVQLVFDRDSSSPWLLERLGPLGAATSIRSESALIQYVLAFLCFLLVLSSSFFKYWRKGVLETILSWIGLSLLVPMFIVLTLGPTYGYGLILTFIFAAAGAALKSFLLIQRARQKLA